MTPDFFSPGICSTLSQGNLNLFKRYSLLVCSIFAIFQNLSLHLSASSSLHDHFTTIVEADELDLEKLDSLAHTFLDISTELCFVRVFVVALSFYWFSLLLLVREGVFHDGSNSLSVFFHTIWILSVGHSNTLIYFISPFLIYFFLISLEEKEGKFTRILIFMGFGITDLGSDLSFTTYQLNDLW